MVPEGPQKHKAATVITGSLQPFTIRWTQIFFRMYDPEKRNSTRYFGKAAKWRFDDPKKKYGVLYGAETYYGAFSETMEQASSEILIPAPNGSVLDRMITIEDRALERRHLCLLEPSRPLILLDLSGKFLRQIHADSRLITGEDYDLSRSYSRAIYDHPDNIDGIYYRARTDPSELSLALFDRCKNSVTEHKRIGNLLDPKSKRILIDILSHYKIALIRSYPQSRKQRRAKKSTH